MQIAPKIRGAAMRALQIVEGSKLDRKYAGMSLSEIFADMIMDGEVETVINMISKFTPKEMLIDVDGSIKVDTSGFNPEQLKEVFSVDEPTALPGTARDAVEVQGSDPVETPSRATVRSIPQPG